ncbi:hypothetical protein BLNAU_174 [Blattamonas nauphoetae]|uniref:Uncharacterized protein n=1 Tax=Blattamonas nauphoetae TaxID=2049346 RepID=A0ABQ9YM81_9EUKA|nr:hypothetical protein BLNAU_174 [Blattamonas nauphoetae]
MQRSERSWIACFLFFAAAVLLSAVQQPERIADVPCDGTPHTHIVFPAQTFSVVNSLNMTDRNLETPLSISIVAKNPYENGTKSVKRVWNYSVDGQSTASYALNNYRAHKASVQCSGDSSQTLSFYHTRIFSSNALGWILILLAFFAASLIQAVYKTDLLLSKPYHMIITVLCAAFVGLLGLSIPRLFASVDLETTQQPFLSRLTTVCKAIPSTMFDAYRDFVEVMKHGVVERVLSKFSPSRLRTFQLTKERIFGILDAYPLAKTIIGYTLLAVSVLLFLFGGVWCRSAIFAAFWSWLVLFNKVAWLEYMNNLAAAVLSFCSSNIQSQTVGITLFVICFALWIFFVLMFLSAVFSKISLRPEDNPTFADGLLEAASHLPSFWVMCVMLFFQSIISIWVSAPTDQIGVTLPYLSVGAQGSSFLSTLYFTLKTLFSQNLMNTTSSPTFIMGLALLSTFRSLLPPILNMGKLPFVPDSMWTWTLQLVYIFIPLNFTPSASATFLKSVLGMTGTIIPRPAPIIPFTAPSGADTQLSFWSLSISIFMPKWVRENLHITNIHLPTPLLYFVLILIVFAAFSLRRPSRRTKSAVMSCVVILFVAIPTFAVFDMWKMEGSNVVDGVLYNTTVLSEEQKSLIANWTLIENEKYDVSGKLTKEEEAEIEEKVRKEFLDQKAVKEAQKTLLEAKDGQPDPGDATQVTLTPEEEEQLKKAINKSKNKSQRQRQSEAEKETKRRNKMGQKVKNIRLGVSRGMGEVTTFFGGGAKHVVYIANLVDAPKEEKAPAEKNGPEWYKFDDERMNVSPPEEIYNTIRLEMVVVLVALTVWIMFRCDLPRGPEIDSDDSFVSLMTPFERKERAQELQTKIEKRDEIDRQNARIPGVHSAISLFVWSLLIATLGISILEQNLSCIPSSLNIASWLSLAKNCVGLSVLFQMGLALAFHSKPTPVFGDKESLAQQKEKTGKVVYPSQPLQTNLFRFKWMPSFEEELLRQKTDKVPRERINYAEMLGVDKKKEKQKRDMENFFQENYPEEAAKERQLQEQAQQMQQSQVRTKGGKKSGRKDKKE